MTLVYSADDSLAGQRCELVNSNRQVTRARIVDVEGLPPGSALGDLLQWDGTQWILVAGGSNVGDVLTWNGAEWVGAPSAGNTAWDHIVESLADLPPAVLGERTLTEGSWAFKNPIDLGTDQLVNPPGTAVLLKGMGGTKVLQSGGTSVFRNEGIAQVETMTFRQNGGTQSVAITGGRYTGTRNIYDGTGLGVVLEGGEYTDSQSRITPGVAGGIGLFVTGGSTCQLSQTRISAPSGSAASISGSIGMVELDQCFLESASNNALLWSAASGDLLSQGTVYQCLAANGTCINVTQASSLNFIDGLWATEPSARGNGLRIDGNVTGGIQVIGVKGQDISTSDASGEAFILWVSGVVRRATVMGCNTATTVATAINWAAANIPTLGLSIVGNTWDDPSPYVGFTHASPRVNAKANQDQAGLMSETPIVP